MPKRYGLAKPFLSIPCRSAPDIPKEDPTNREAINRGNLSSQIIVWLSSSPFWKIASQISLLLIGTVPLDKDKIETVTKRNKRITKKNISLIFWNLIFQPQLLIDNYYSKFWIYKFKSNINKSFFIFYSIFKIIF